MTNRNTDDRALYEEFLGLERSHVPIEAVWDFKVTRASGAVECHRVKNTMTAAGLNKLAQLGITSGDNGVFQYLAIGTQTEASSLGSTQAGMGEVDRKLASTVTTSKEYMILVATWAGAVDGVTSVDLRTASAVNDPASGSGAHLNFVNSVATILADSDFLRVQMNVRVGSHDL